MILQHKRIEAAKAELLAETKGEARRVGKIVGRRHQSYVGQVRRRSSSHNPLSILDGWTSSTATMHPLGHSGPEALCLGEDGTVYSCRGDYYHRENIDRYGVEALAKLLEAIRKLER